MREETVHLNGREEGEKAVVPDDPFVTRPFLEAASLLPPGRGRGFTLSARAGAATHHWGVVEMSRFGLKAAVAWAAPSGPPGSGRAAVWPSLLSAVADRGHAVLRMGSHSTVRLGAADLASIRSFAAEAGWRLRTSPFGTYVIDLRIPEEKRATLLERNHRQAVRKTDKAGMALARLDRASLREFMRVSDETYRRQGLEPHPRRYFEALIDQPRSFRFYAAIDREGRHHANAVIAVRGAHGIYLHGGSGHRDVPGAGVWLHWRIANDLAESGFTAYDLGGVDVTEAEGKAAGIRAFKARFGGVFERYEALDVVFRPRLDSALRHALALARRLRLV
ncbi:MAG TPA: peptidoglycan bridge formation glycyltransferase FemA/FemB family protein [Candidatus Thermoplasmatota archaeon]|nr:peptidoglycan bridge formation glycyltransferase FemA/FemB family protein [Candidatus Thermoplasmatota archaeon]